MSNEGDFDDDFYEISHPLFRTLPISEVESGDEMALIDDVGCRTVDRHPARAIRLLP